MKTGIKIIIFLFLLTGVVRAQVYQTIANGNFSDGSIWSTNGGVSTCSCTPGGSNQIEIYHNVILDNDLTNGGGNYGQVSDTLRIHSGGSLQGSTYNMTVASGGVLINDDTLVVNNMDWNNGSYVCLNSGSYTLITGDLTNSNNSDNVKIDGSVKVNGNLSNGVGGIITGGGSISVDGTTTNNGTIPGALLPIELIYFNAEVLNDNSVQLNWATALEINNQYFAVERGTSMESFEAIATIDGAGNSTSRIDYTYTDATFDESTVYYYRLKQTDFDGTSTYSDVIAISVNSMEFINIYPNPAVDNTTIRINANESTVANIYIYNLVGNIVKQQTQNIIKGSSVITFDVSSFASGNYIIVGKTADGLSKTQKTFIKR